MPTVPRVRSRALPALAFLVLFSAIAPAAEAQTYFPAAGDGWERRTPQQVGLVAAQVQAAVDFAIESGSNAPRDLLEQHLRSFGREPFGEAVAPFKERGEPSGLIIRNGYIVA